MKRTIIVFISLIIALFMLSLVVTLAESEEVIDANSIYLYTGSPLVLHNNHVSSLDPNNPDVVATVVGDRTLLPLRTISEYFGAEVSYDDGKREAIIVYEGSRYVFPVGEKQYIVSRGDTQQEIAMDTQSLIQNDRIMVPIRVISENILKLKVSYYDRVIAIGDQEVNLKIQNSLVKKIKTKIGAVIKPGSFEEVRLAFSTSQSLGYPMVDMVKSATPAMDSFSTTNPQVEGIDEADIVKTDGTHIYLVSSNAVRIVKAEKGQLEETGILKLDQTKSVQDLYIDDNWLIIMGTRYESVPYPMVDGSPAIDMDIAPVEDRMISILPIYYGKNYTFVDVYDITDPKNPEFIKTHEMEGNYQTSRKNGDIVYLITNTYFYDGSILPMVKDTATGKAAKALDLSDVMIMPGYPSQGFLSVSSIDVTNQDEAEVEAIAAQGFITYMNDSALFLASSDYNGNTTITKLGIDGMKVGYAGSGTVEGTLLNQFSMDQYEGNLRVATNTWNDGNGLYVLDDSLNVIGSVTGLAKGETIYSVRFFGDKGYIVTFRNMDPLFVFDLKDPKNPKLTGELKIPGFSNYLHPVGEDLLLGIGAETTEIYQKDAEGNEVVIGNRQGGIKVSLFDVSDMGEPKEISKVVTGYSGSYSEAFYNHKAIMFDSESKIVFFDADITTGINGSAYKQGALVISYDKNDLELNGILGSEPVSVYGTYTPYGGRVLAIGEYLYYTRDGRVSSFVYQTLIPVDSIVLQ